MISVVTFVRTLIDLSLYPLATKVLYPYSHTFVSLHFMKLFYSVFQLEMLLLNPLQILFIGFRCLQPYTAASFFPTSGLRL